jgi:phosphoribosylformylglycinamidine synthase
MRVGVVYYPGSNCEQDAVHACRMVGLEAELVWHKQESVDGCAALILAGGFSYGDYLRCGAIAQFSPVMKHVERFAADGHPILGICNGFQILVEMGLLPGALLANAGLKFRCQDTRMKVEHTDSPFTNACTEGQILRLNMAHYEGNYFADAETLEAIEANGQVVMRFCGPDGQRGAEYNPNGSINDIAALRNEAGNVMGLMPHPERVLTPELGSADGRIVFESLRDALAANEVTGPIPALDAAEVGADV